MITSSIIKKLWRGRYPLPDVFFNFYVLGNAPLFIVSLMMLNLTPHLFSFFKPTISDLIIQSLSMLIFYPYLVISSVGVWRSATVYSAVPWHAVAAQIVVIIVDAGVIWRFLTFQAPFLLNDVLSLALGVPFSCC
jgi:hypothetical protein